MPIAYSNETTIKLLEIALEDIGNFYNASCLNWKGQTTERLNYSEVIAEHLLRLGINGKLSQIVPIVRKGYKAPHDGSIQNCKSGRDEENLAKELHKKELPYIGNIIDYQVPLKAIQSDKAGKIDLISVSSNPKKAFIIELKHEKNTETLLRTALEISTYYCRLSHDNFIASYNDLTGLKSKDIKKALLLVEGSNASKEAMRLERLPNLKTLIHELEVDIFGLRIEDRRYAVERINY